MSSILSKIKNYFRYLLSSLREIIKGGILFLLAISGVFSAVIFRSLDFNGVIISIISICVEFFAMVICYFTFRAYLQQRDSNGAEIQKKQKELK
ncbi:MAG: hypothetical protein BAJALOKI1v1_650012 [Promethearchaeota archaeon]|nr:MAG: hypothetical protein BAJALOKI1v1_650012 [Candidatus Lokiarchaeota archaeon]